MSLPLLIFEELYQSLWQWFGGQWQNNIVQLTLYQLGKMSNIESGKCWKLKLVDVGIRLASSIAFGILLMVVFVVKINQTNYQQLTQH
jgi:hypothetical protein